MVLVDCRGLSARRAHRRVLVRACLRGRPLMDRLTWTIYLCAALLAGVFVMEMCR